MLSMRRVLLAFVVVAVVAGLVVVAVPNSPPASAMKLQPLGDQVVLHERLDVDYLPGSGPANPANHVIIADVLAVGPGEFSPYTGERIPVDLAVGDVVFLLPGDATEVWLEGYEYLIASSRDVLAVVR